MPTTTYRIASWPALIGGMAAAGASVAFLWRDALSTGWTIEHGVMPILVGLTILSAHLLSQAARERRWVSALAFAVLAVAGSCIIVVETMGRRAEVRETKVAAASKSADDLGRIGADFAKASALVAEAQTWVAHECRSGNGPRCRGTQFTLAQRVAYSDKLRAQLEAASVPPPVDPKADKIAAAASLLGGNGALARDLVKTFDPFTLALFFELASVFLFGFGIRHQPPAKVVEPETEPEEVPSGGGIPLNHPVLIELRRHQRPLSNDDLARAMGCSKSEASKRWREVQQHLNVKREGRHLRIAMH